MTTQHTEQSERAELSQFLKDNACGGSEFNAKMLRAAALLAADKPAESGGEAVTFEQAWAKYEAKGFRYGRDALEQVRFGWKIAHEYTKPQADKVGGEVDYCCKCGEAHLPQDGLLCRVCKCSTFTHPQTQPSALPDDVVKDAERYRLLRTWDVRAHGLYVTNGSNPVYDLSLDALLDAAIDAAMLKEGKNEGQN